MIQWWSSWHVRHSSVALEHFPLRAITGTGGKPSTMRGSLLAASTSAVHSGNAINEDDAHAKDDGFPPQEDSSEAAAGAQCSAAAEKEGETNSEECKRLQLMV